MFVNSRNLKSRPVVPPKKAPASEPTDAAFVATFLPDKLKEILQTPVDAEKQSAKFGYLLSCNLLMKYFETRNGKERSDILIFLKQTGIAYKMIGFIFGKLDVDSAPVSNLRPDLELEDLAGYVFKQVIYKLPSTVRVWWRDLNSRRTSTAVERYVSQYISQGLIDDEFRKIQIYNKDPSVVASPQEAQFSSNLTPDSSKFTVTGLRGSVNEVHASYEKDDVVATIILSLADNHPLRAVTVSSKHRMGINESTWRTWLLSMTTLLLTQDGSLVDAALLWQNSLDKHFDGTELCPICYALFHASNHSLPQMPCKTCKTKFHSACLLTWFNNSHKNECPICRTAFS